MICIISTYIIPKLMFSGNGNGQISRMCFVGVQDLTTLFCNQKLHTFQKGMIFQFAGPAVSLRNGFTTTSKLGKTITMAAHYVGQILNLI